MFGDKPRPPAEPGLEWCIYHGVKWCLNLKRSADYSVSEEEPPAPLPSGEQQCEHPPPPLLPFFLAFSNADCRSSSAAATFIQSQRAHRAPRFILRLPRSLTLALALALPPNVFLPPFSCKPPLLHPSTQHLVPMSHCGIQADGWGTKR